MRSNVLSLKLRLQTTFPKWRSLNVWFSELYATSTFPIMHLICPEILHNLENVEVAYGDKFYQGDIYLWEPPFFSSIPKYHALSSTLLQLFQSKKPSNNLCIRALGSVTWGDIMPSQLGYNINFSLSLLILSLLGQLVYWNKYVLPILMWSNWGIIFGILKVLDLSQCPHHLWQYSLHITAMERARHMDGKIDLYQICSGQIWCQKIQTRGKGQRW